MRKASLDITSYIAFKMVIDCDLDWAFNEALYAGNSKEFVDSLIDVKDQIDKTLARFNLDLALGHWGREEDD